MITALILMRSMIFRDPNIFSNREGKCSGKHKDSKGKSKKNKKQLHIRIHGKVGPSLSSGGISFMFSCLLASLLSSLKTLQITVARDVVGGKTR